jgi:hypothetical protein
MTASVNGKPTFGAGRFFGINNVTNPTPARTYVQQDMSIDFKQATKELFGEKKFAVSVAAGEMSISGKVTMGAPNVRTLGDYLFNASGSAGQILEADKEAGTIPAPSGPYTVTVANSGTWTTDLGVMKADGTVMTRVASGPSAGQYSVASGVYTFAAADTGANVLISYLYTNSSQGEKLTLANTLQGPAGAFTAVMCFLYGSAAMDVLTLNNAIAQDFSLATKQGDFDKPNFGFMASADSSDNLGTFAFQYAA